MPSGSPSRRSTGWPHAPAKGRTSNRLSPQGYQHTAAGRTTYYPIDLTPPATRPAAGPFYATTRGAYERWGGPGALSPSRFPPGTAQITYYFTFAGATPNTPFHATAYHFYGNEFIHGLARMLRHCSGAFMATFSYLPSFPWGVYRLEIIAGSQRVATFSFVVDHWMPAITAHVQHRRAGSTGASCALSAGGCSERPARVLSSLTR